MNGLEAVVSAFADWFSCGVRFVLPVLAILIVVRCGLSLLQRDAEDIEVWGWLTLPNGSRVALRHWENILGRSGSSDVCLAYPTLSRRHAAIIRDMRGNWVLYDLHSRHGVRLNRDPIGGQAELHAGDLLSLGDVDLVFLPLTAEEETAQAESRTVPGRTIRPGFTLLLLLLFQLLLTLQHCIAADQADVLQISVCFFVLILLTWCAYLLIRAMRRTGFEIETLAFLLSSVGFSVAATSAPGFMWKNTLCLVLGVGLFFCIGWCLRDLNRVRRLRWAAAAAGLLLLAVNVFTAESLLGARNWLSIGRFSFQPSELVKVFFVFAGAATLDRLFRKRNIWLFVVYSGLCVLALAVISDFGTAVVFFTAYLVIAYLRSGDAATVILSVAAALFAGATAITLRPYIAVRFSRWGNAWADLNGYGYQQTRTMTAAASGGLFGQGAGKGWLHTVVAADTDMVFGVVSEELGLLIALCLVAALLLLAVFVACASRHSRSSYYSIASAAAVSILLMQVILNVFGSMDMLPFTGVTFPFVSRGGSSLIASWGLLAFIRAADTRQNASFTVKLPKRRKTENDQ